MLSTKGAKALEVPGFLRNLALSAPRCAQMVTHKSSAHTKTAAQIHTPTRCRGHKLRYQRLKGSQGSIGLGDLYTVFSLALLLLLTWPALVDSNH